MKYNFLIHAEFHFFFRECYPEKEITVKFYGERGANRLISIVFSFFF